MRAPRKIAEKASAAAAVEITSINIEHDRTDLVFRSIRYRIVELTVIRRTAAPGPIQITAQNATRFLMDNSPGTFGRVKLYPLRNLRTVIPDAITSMFGSENAATIPETAMATIAAASKSASTQAILAIVPYSLALRSLSITIRCYLYLPWLSLKSDSGCSRPYPANIIKPCATTNGRRKVLICLKSEELHSSYISGRSK